MQFNKTVIKQMRHEKSCLNIVITGGTRGLGKEMAKQFANLGDNVYVNSRNATHVKEFLNEIENKSNNKTNIQGYVCDVGNKHSLVDFVKNVQDDCGLIDIWINNAGASGGYRKFIEHNDDTIQNIVSTNLLGTMLATRHAMDIMSENPTGGAIYNISGAGAMGEASPFYSLYGGTKSGIVQFSKTLQHEMKDTSIDIHILSPGMMLTDLLTENIAKDILSMINFLCTSPELVAHHLVPRIRRAYYNMDQDSNIKYLTVLKIIYKALADKLTFKHVSKL